MPSWNIHIAHVEKLVSGSKAEMLGIPDTDCFLFGNLVPDIYVGFMVPETTFRIDYCLTHMAVPDLTPAPDADRFWDECVIHPTRGPESPNVSSLTLGAWAHLVADRTYNLRFRDFCATRKTPRGDELRRRKQDDFRTFGHSLNITSHVSATPELLDAARRFRPYSILPADVSRAIDVASAIVYEPLANRFDEEYLLLDRAWLTETFEECQHRIESWLAMWQRLVNAKAQCSSAAIRKALREESPTP